MAPAEPAKRRRTVSGERVTLIVGTALLLVLRLADPAPLASLRVGLFDFFQQLQPRHSASDAVAIVDIDEASMARFGQWPWPRDLLARLTSAIARQGPRVIGFDILFSEADRLSPEAGGGGPESAESNDAQFARSMTAAQVVLGVAAVEAAIPPSHSPRQPSLMMAGGDPAPHLRRYAGLVSNLELLESAARGLGLISVELDRDGVLRRIPALARVDEAILPALEIEMLRIAAGARPLRIAVGAHGIVGVAPAGGEIATDPRGRIWIYYAQPDRSRYVTVADVLAGAESQDRFAGKYVLVGSTAAGLRDLHMTPLGVPMFGIEVHAQFLENLLLDVGLNRPASATAAEIVLVLAIGLAVIGARRWLSGWRLALLFALVGGVLAGGAWYAFAAHRLLLDASYPLLSMTALILLVAGQNARAVRRTAEANVQAREARLRELQAELAQASRQTDIGQLASALAHELNQPVGAIGNFLRASRRLLAKAEPEPAADVRHYVNQAIDQADRAAAIIEGIRALADTGHAPRAAGDINAAVEEALAIALLDRRGEGVAVVARPADGLPPVLMNRIQVQQVVLNLVRNAIEAMAASPRRELVVETRLLDGAGVEVAVGDTGPGLAPEVEARLFKPFVSTKDTGMGIGLSISRSLIESQDGRLAAERNAAGGTTFRFTLPLARAGGPADQS